MTVKKSMLIIWAVASLLWIGFSVQIFNLDEVVNANRQLNIYETRYEHGERTKQMRETILRANKRVQAANKEFILFLVVSCGIPGMMLSLGAYLLRNHNYNHRHEPLRRRIK